MESSSPVFVSPAIIGFVDGQASPQNLGVIWRPIERLPSAAFEFVTSDPILGLPGFITHKSVFSVRRVDMYAELISARRPGPSSSAFPSVSSVASPVFVS